MLMLSCFSCISLRKAAEVMYRIVLTENHPLQQSVSRAAPARALCCTGAQLGIHLPLTLRLSALSDSAHN